MRLGTSLLAALAGCSERVASEEPPPTPCTSDAECSPPLTCGDAGLCEDVEAPCHGLECGGSVRGQCEAGDPDRCVCNDGYSTAVSEFLCCDIDGPDPICGAVEAAPGNAGGLCLAPDGSCSADDLECDPEANICVDEANPCLGFYCGGSERGTCSASGDRPRCSCNEGFENETFALYCCPTDGSDPNCPR
jgi:hypothetical protein